MAFLDDILEGVGTIADYADKPRRWAWSQFGLPESGTEVLAQKLGMDRDSLLTQGLGFALESVADPMALAAPAVGGLAKLFGRGASAASRLGKAGRGAMSLADDVAPYYPGVTPRVAPATSQPNIFLSEAAANQARSGQPTIARLASNDPGDLMATGLASGNTSVGGLAAGSRLRPTYERFSRFRNVEPLDPGQTDQLLEMAQSGGSMPPGMAGAVVNRTGVGPVGFQGDVSYIAPGGGRASDILARTLAGHFSDADLQTMRKGGMANFSGAYSPETNAMVTARGPEQVLARRHEGLHGLVQNAALTGDYSSLSPIGKIAAWLKGPQAKASKKVDEMMAAGIRPSEADFVASDLTARTAIGDIFNELNSFSGESRGLRNQIASGLGYLFPTPKELILGSDGFHDYYMKQTGAHNPLIGMLYRGLGVAPWAGGAFVGGQFLGEGLNSLLGRE